MSADFWIFGYGSLVWRPDFEFEDRRMAYVADWRRRFWQASPDHRGVPEAPGRVATMLRWPGSGCWGAAYRVAEPVRDGILAALDEREKAGYERVDVPVAATVEDAPFATALTWVAPSHNPNYLGLAPLAEMAAQIQRSSGPSGDNRDYVLRLAEALRGIESEDDQVFQLERLLLDA